MSDFENQVAGVYNQAAAQAMMTLSGIAYFDDKNGTRASIKTGIIAELANPLYATLGQWSLVWGPVLFKGTDNLIYVARLKQSGIYAIVMRGTAPNFASIYEDVPTSQDDFAKFSAPGAEVSSEFRKALIGLTMLPDPDTQMTLIQFLAKAARTTPGSIFYCTGHSQGGALVPMMTGWLSASAASWNVRQLAYSFAGPTSGNPAFAAWVDSTLSLVRVVNPLDVVPYGYAGIDQIIKKNIPSPITIQLEKDCLSGTLDIIAYMLTWVGKFQQPSAEILLSGKAATGSLIDQVGIQHECNSYLKLLGAPQLDFLPKSPL